MQRGDSLVIERITSEEKQILEKKIDILTNFHIYQRNSMSKPSPEAPRQLFKLEEKILKTKDLKDKLQNMETYMTLTSKFQEKRASQTRAELHRVEPSHARPKPGKVGRQSLPSI